VSDALRESVLADAIEDAAANAWQQDHPRTPWELAPESVRASMRALVGNIVTSVVQHLDARSLLDLEAEPDTFPTGTTHQAAIGRALDEARRRHTTVRYVYKGVPVVARFDDAWQDVAGRYEQAAEDAVR
jgi:hypothetical protein